MLFFVICWLSKTLCKLLKSIVLCVLLWFIYKQLLWPAEKSKILLEAIITCWRHVIYLNFFIQIHLNWKAAVYFFKTCFHILSFSELYKEIHPRLMLFKKMFVSSMLIRLTYIPLKWPFVRPKDIFFKFTH